MQEQTQIFAGEGLSNIFDGALVSQIDKDTNQLHHKKVIGFRLENVESKNVRVLCRSQEDLRGVYSAMVYFDGVRRRAKGKRSFFFPKDWTREKVIDAVFAAYQNKVSKNIEIRQYIGQSPDGMEIVLWLDESDRITDAMPLRDVTAFSPPKRNLSKRFCNQCGQPKHRVCLEHHPFPKKGLRKIYSKIRYRVRKFYFYFSEKLKFAG